MILEEIEPAPLAAGERHAVEKSSKIKLNDVKNIYESNTQVQEKVREKSKEYLRKYLQFIEKAKYYLQNQSHSLSVERVEVVLTESELSQEIKHNPKSVYRIYLKEPEDKNKRSLEELFSDFIHEVYEDKDFNREKAIKILDKNEDENYIEVDREINGKEIYLKPNTYQLDCQIKAVKRLLGRPLPEHEPLLYLFGRPWERYWKQKSEISDLPWKILTREDIEGVHEQRDFVRKALSTRDFAFMEGPPGSGKTTTIIELIDQFVMEGKRVLLCSSTHAAIDNVIERITGRYKDSLGEDIIPVRISRSYQSVKESVKPYILQEIAKTYREEILKFLRKNHELESQKYLLENLDSKEGLEWIENLILEVSNLVCGTMIGILQHPAIKQNKDDIPFDVMIVDEASKVTFLDFIVPALYAKKWILVGDIKQLPPYIEETYIQEYLRSLILESKYDETAILERAELKKVISSRNSRELIIYFTRRDVSQELEELQKEVDEIIERDTRGYDRGMRLLLDKDFYIMAVTDKDLNHIDPLELNAADLLICQDSEKVRAFIEKHIFVKAVVVGSEDSLFEEERLFSRRQRYLHQDKVFQFHPDGASWAEKVTDLMIQSYSFRDVRDTFSRVVMNLFYLLPGDLWESVNEIKSLIFPSILEILQRGAGKTPGQKDDRLLTDGFSDEHKETRFVSLTYQHRMHPEIAEIACKHFYGGKNLHSGRSVQDRPWSDPWGGPRVLWIPNQDPTGNQKNGRIVNPTEVQHMKEHLIKFLEWAKNNPRPNGEKYELAILTFYLHQCSELRKMVREVTGQYKRFSKFQKHNVDIFLYTVDKFQGQEADVVFLGFTKFTRYAHYNSPNRLNVALTRARHKLLLFGNRGWFAQNAILPALKELAINKKHQISYQKIHKL